ncbi:putative glycoside hydrolase [Bacillaceae bacterium Marseille-Q3522]|nr:putative glycoside hydrolase [Bacillaceae bacterium Marseille-Q3522]
MLQVKRITALTILFCFLNALQIIRTEAAVEVRNLTDRTFYHHMKLFSTSFPRFLYNSGYDFTYPDAVRGIYVTGHSAGGAKFQSLLQLIDETDLNAMVIDIKDDWGYLTYVPDKSSNFSSIGRPYIKNTEAMMKTLEEKSIYPIARIVVFKDSVLANKKPELSFQDGEKVWTNKSGDAFVNPFIKEVWDYNVNIAIEAAKMGFQEIQFDYVRFPEGFETWDKILHYSKGEYVNKNLDDAQKRVAAVTDFVQYAKEKLKSYNVKVSVDIFGYSATLPEAPGIGQNFTKIAKNVDVISSMIYPSHWTSYFQIAKPDLEPYRLVSEYMKVEKGKLAAIDNPPVSRPWLQDFTALWLGKGNYLVYGKQEIEAQIKALQDHGVKEFLLWNAGNTYSPGVDYTPQ